MWCIVIGLFLKWKLNQALSMFNPMNPEMKREKWGESLSSLGVNQAQLNLKPASRRHVMTNDAQKSWKSCADKQRRRLEPTQ
jgi:hypothetical protein